MEGWAYIPASFGKRTHCVYGAYKGCAGVCPHGPIVCRWKERAEVVHMDTLCLNAVASAMVHLIGALGGGAHYHTTPRAGRMLTGVTELVNVNMYTLEVCRGEFVCVHSVSVQCIEIICVCTYCTAGRCTRQRMAYSHCHTERLPAVSPYECRLEFTV